MEKMTKPEIGQLTLRHYSGKHITKLGPAPIRQSYFPAKPAAGLWVSVDGNGDGWKDWCDDQDLWPESLRYKYVVELADDADILLITNRNELGEFTEKYAATDGLGKEINGRGFVHALDWDAAARDHQGIIITPYLWSARLDFATMWYYGWDCASGCIWDLSAIETFKLVDPAAHV